jgi:TonB family protein
MSLSFANFGFWCLQVALVIAAGAMLPWIFRLGAPKPRLLYLHLLLAACLVLPVVQPYRERPIVVRSNVSVTMGPVQIAAGGENSFRLWTPAEIAIAIVAAGAAMRLLWLGLGLFRLRRYRKAAERLLPLPDEARNAIRRLGVDADFYVSEDVASPVTFGARNPVVLLPAGFMDLPPGRREPVFYHELLHVRRNDWLFAIGEELVRCALWFHPAVWWLIARIHLTREQVVDHAVIEYTNQPETYVDALIAIAATRLEADLAPAPLFLKKRHLRQRVASIVKGVSMSKRKLFLSSFAVFAALPLIIGFTAWQFPLNAAPQEIQDGNGVDVNTGAARILHRGPVNYPAAARDRGISGTVVVTANLDSKGQVIDARVVSGPDELRKAALAAVLDWHFATPAPPTAQVSIRFTGDAAAVLKPVPPAVQMPGKSYLVETVDLSQLQKDLQDRIAAAPFVREGETINTAKFAELQRVLHDIDEHLNFRASIKDNKLTVRPYLSDGAVPAYRSSGPAKSAAVDSGQTVPAPIRVGGNVQASNLVSKATPVYPPLAKQAGVQGVVRMNATIDKEGHVTSLDLISGHPLLAPAAVDAVKQWVYRPTLLNGNPVDVITQVDVNFTLAP